jgi:hypothetical protein
VADRHARARSDRTALKRAHPQSSGRSEAGAASPERISAAHAIHGWIAIVRIVERMNVQLLTRLGFALEDRVRVRCALLRAAVVLLAACASETAPAGDDQARGAVEGEQDAGSSENPDSSEDPDSAEPAMNPDPAAELHGWFTVKLMPEMPATPFRAASAARAAVLGKISDGPTPEATIWSETAQEGDCVLRTPRVPFCDPSCGGTALCVDDDVCLSHPTAQSVGVVRALGLGAEFSMQPIAGNYQQPPGTTLAYPPCEEGAEIRLEAEGNGYQPFALAAKCVVPMEFAGPVRIEPGEPLAFAWTAGRTDVARVRIDLDISHHGGSKGKIECDVEDSGSAQIPAALLQQLVDLGVAGFPSVVVMRLVAAEGSTAQSRKVTLTVSSAMEQQVEIPGLMSCTADAHCPSGNCRDDNKTCE